MLNTINVAGVVKSTLCRAKFHLDHLPRCPLIVPNLRVRSIVFDSQQMAPRLVAGNEELQLFQRNCHQYNIVSKAGR